jgi:maltose O-acetyltransferase
MPIVGKICRKLRYACCKKIFKFCGKNANIERKAFFGNGLNICIGENSSLGVNSHVPDNIQIGDNVMMAENCYILSRNHKFDRTDIPMIFQGATEKMLTIIEGDVWIGRNVLFTPGRMVRKGSIVAAGCVLSKNFPEYSIIAGNPCRLIKSRR